MNNTRGNFNEGTGPFVYQGVGALNPKDAMFFDFWVFKAIFVPGRAIIQVALATFKFLLLGLKRWISERECFQREQLPLLRRRGSCWIARPDPVSTG
jgi:hypothetical protein